MTEKLEELTDLDACMICEDNDDYTPEQVIAAWQHLIDTGLVWKLQGFYGRTAKALIESGVCHEQG